MANKLQVRNLYKRFEVQEGLGHMHVVDALSGIDLDVAEGQFVSIIGPSGCGKSTLLMIVAGLQTCTRGDITVDGKPVKGPGLDRGVVFQDFALFPWMTVQRNVEVGLRNKGVGAQEAAAKATQLLKMVGLEEFRNEYPHRLSGGMKQRVAVARALAYDPAILLMDEPFGALDAQTRGKLQNQLAEIWRQTRKTVLFVTHSAEEAVFLSDQVVVLEARPGRVSEVVNIDLPRPRNRLSEEFVRMQRRLAIALAQVQGMSDSEDVLVSRAGE